jgi:L-threonylcarbamoyladenylate synthase
MQAAGIAMTRVLPPTRDNLVRAAEVLRDGGLVAIPTETVYGLAANALDARACARIFEAKDRPLFDPLIVHVAEHRELDVLCAGVDKRAQRLIDRFWPGPLTLVLPKTDRVPDLVTAGLATVAVRMPAHVIARELIRLAGVALAAPSANRFGRLSPTTAEHVVEQLADRVDLVIDGGPCPVGVESTIIDVTGPAPRLLRPGGIPFEELAVVIGDIEIAAATPDRPTAPGQLASHYAPRTPLAIIPLAEAICRATGRVGLLALRMPTDCRPFAHIECLSPSGDLPEAAAKLFAALHRLDAAGLDAIYAEPIPDAGLGRAIMDRLRRAAHRGDRP